MKSCVVIPARYKSSRFPGKPLHKILGKELIHHVYNNCKKSKLFNQIIIATPDKEIYDFLFNLAPSDPFKLVPIEKPISMSASKHIGYAIQWFGLSVVLVVMTLIAFLKKNE